MPGDIRDFLVERGALLVALKDCADDLESEINARYNGPSQVHPALQRRYERDMEPVVVARRLLEFDPKI